MTAALEGGEWSAAHPGCFTPGKEPVPILQEAGWAPGPARTGGKYRPHRDSIPDRPARSQSLYRLSYPAHLHVKCPLHFCPTLTKFRFSLKTSIKISKITSIKFHENVPGAGRADRYRQTNRRTDTTKLMGPLRDGTNAPKNRLIFYKQSLLLPYLVSQTFTVHSVARVTPHNTEL